MRNKQIDLDNTLFAQLERLDDDKLKGEKLLEEVARAKAMQGIAAQIINSRKMQLDAMRLVAEGHARACELPEGFEIKNHHKLTA
jgi:hypothetical protein